jgi:hypothetical protein
MDSVRMKTHVLAGNRIEIVTPELPEGQPVEIIVVPDTAPSEQREDIVAFLDSLPINTRTLEEWEELDREFQRERNSWDR